MLFVESVFVSAETICSFLEEKKDTERQWVS